jgi:hypothetical protein
MNIHIASRKSKKLCIRSVILTLQSFARHIYELGIVYDYSQLHRRVFSFQALNALYKLPLVFELRMHYA